MKKTFRLRTWLFISFTLISVIPVLLLGAWVKESALTKEINAVKEKHLLLAHNITRALSRYAHDAKAVFRYVATSGNETALTTVDIQRLLQSIHLDHVCISDRLGNTIRTISAGNVSSSEHIHKAVLDQMSPRLTNSADVVFSDVMPAHDGSPMMYLGMRIGDDRYAIGAMRTSYLTEIQQSITFGKLGHAAIVDTAGRVLAHPNAEWQATMKDISQLDPVARMMAGETGVSFFYSPAIKKHMIAGYSSVADVGWGVMIPQPMEELEDRARDVLGLAVLLAILGIFIAVLVSWRLSGLLAKPVLAIAESARRFAAGEPGQKVELSVYAPQELQSLTRSFSAMTRDVTRANDAVRENSEILQATLDNMVEGIVMTDDHDNLIMANRKFAEFFKLPDHFLGTTVPLPALVEHMADQVDFSTEDQAMVNQTHRLLHGADSEQSIRLLDGSIIEQRSNKLCGGGMVVSYTDITERKRTESRIRHLASFDSLTNLPNRATFQERLNLAIGLASESGHNGVLVYMDLDQFKDINDTLGHAVGDRILEEVASRLKSCVDEGDLTARLGGDEFAIIRNQISCPEQPEQLAHAIIDAITEPFHSGTNELYLGVAIGIAYFPLHGKEADQVLKNADLAMYAAKARRRNSYRIFDPEMDAEAKDRKHLEDDLRRALDNRDLSVVYQPTFSLNGLQISGMEALVRWQHAVHGEISPAAFIPVAESTGMIMDLGKRVLNRACRDGCELLRLNPDLRLSVNLSVAQFTQGDVLSLVSAALDKTGFPSQNLELEITESTLMRDFKTALTTLEHARELGITVAIDDFGTGYSSLSQLSRLPVDRIKLDGSFIRRINGSGKSSDAAIVKAILGLANSLDLPVVAEGVETYDQYRFLSTLGCQEFQGHYFARPLDKDGLKMWIRNQPEVAKTQLG